MLTYYLKIAFRHLWLQKKYTFLNILSLSLGMACSTLIILWVQHELSFDRFHMNRDNIYRVYLKGNINNQFVKSASTPALLGPDANMEFPEVKTFVRFQQLPQAIAQVDDQIFYENEGLIADSTLFDIFSFKLITGNPGTALSAPYSLIINEVLAEKFFGNKTPLGKMIELNGANYTITGVIQKLPENSHLQFSFLCSFATEQERNPNNLSWTSDNAITYILLNPGIDPLAFEKKLQRFIEEKAPFWKKINVEFGLQSLKDVHFDSDFAFNYGSIGDKKNVYIFSSISLLVLIIACINFINLYISYSAKRARETGLKKTFGATRGQLILQYMLETVWLVFIAFILSNIFIEMFIPFFNDITGKQISIHYSEPGYLLTIILLLAVTALISGSYPAYYLSCFQPIKILKADIYKGKKGAGFRRGMVIFQFLISVILIITTITIGQQMKFLKNKKLGFNKENIVCLPLRGEIKKNYQNFKQQLLKYPDIYHVTAKSCLPTQRNDGGSVSKEGMNIEEAPNAERCWVDYDYFRTLDIEIIAGRSFSTDLTTDVSESCLLNEKAVRELGLSSPIGEKIYFNDEQRTVIGVIKDVQTKSLHYPIDPQVYILVQSYYWDESMLFIKIARDIPSAIASIEKMWKEISPQLPFEYSFLEQTYDTLYKSEQRTALLLNYFTFLAIFISTLGLFNLASYMAEQRTKEIGIRKVNGATASNIMILLNTDFTQWVGIALVIACPIAYYAMDKWLQNFAYKTELSWWIFALAGLIVLIIALLTVSWQSWRAARRNPVESLRYE